MMKTPWTTLLLLLASLTHAVLCQDVECFNSASCGTAPVSMSLEDCCLGNPGGVAYRLSGEEQCNICVVFGWAVTSLVDVERESGYMLEIGYIKGSSETAAEFKIVVSNGTAYEGVDFDVRSTVVSGAVMTDSVELVLREDGVAQEGDETFTLTLVSTTSSLFEANFFLVDELSVTIIDADVVVFQLVGECAAEEGGGSVIIHIVKEGNVSLANSVTLSITPLTIEDAEGRVSLLDIPPANDLSPNRADYSDFDATPQIITFPSDEGGDLISEVDVSVAIQDDDINEALEQYFILTMDVMTATDQRSIDTQVRNSTLCSITDNDPIRLGFERSNYLFVRPLTQTFDDTIFLVKENGQVSEQTFYARVTTSPSSGSAVSAVLNVDYSLTEFGLNFATLLFPPHLDRVPVLLNLLAPDGNVKVVEFQLTVAMVGDTPIYQPPANLFLDTVVTIEALQIGFVVQQLLVTEESVATLEVSVLSGTLTTDVTVYFSTQDGTALSGLDFTGIGRLSLTFSSEISSLTVDVNITSDSSVERNETVQCLLEFLKSDDYSDISLSLVPSEATITIEDLSDGLPQPDEKDDMVACYATDSCQSASKLGTMTLQNCCVDADGFSYFGRSGCTICSVYGWNVTNLTVTESSEAISVPLRMVKGSSDFPFIAFEVVDETPPSDDDHDVVSGSYSTTSNDISTFLFNVPIDGIINEPDRLLRFALQPVMLPPGLLLTNTLEVTVQDADEFSFGFGEVDYRAYEHDELTQGVTVVLLDYYFQVAAPIGIQLTTLTFEDSVPFGNPHVIPPPDSSFSPNLADYADFPKISKRMDIMSFIPDAFFSINVTDDDINEGYVQSFIVMLEVVDVYNPSLVDIPLERRFTMIHIFDNDDIEIGFTQETLHVDEPENGRTVIINEILLQKNRQTEQTFVLHLGISNGCFDGAPARQLTDENTQSDADFAITTNGILFPPDMQTLPIIVTLFGDNRIEGLECFQISASAGSTIGPFFSLPSYNSDAFQTVQVYIQDSAIIVFGFEQKNYSVPESVESVEICTVISPAEAPQVIEPLDVNIIPVTAGFEDFIPGFEDFIPFAFDNSRSCFNLIILDDDLREQDEILNITLTDSYFQYLEDNGYTIGLSHTIVTIQDDSSDRTDVISFLSTPPVLREDDEVVTILVGVQDIDGGFNSGTVAMLTIQDISEGADKITIPITFESPSVPVQFSLVNNDVYEVESEISVSLKILSAANSTAEVGETPVSIILQDDDILQFSWSAENLTVSEDAGMTTIPISFTGNAGQYQVIVNWAIGEGSADVEDFLNITDQVVLSNSVRSQNISVSIIQDDISELDETFTLSLESVSLFDTSNLVTVNLTEGDRDRLLFTIRETTVTIQDDDVVTVGFLDSPSEIVVNEDVGDILLEVGILSGMFTFDIAIEIFTIPLSASAELDYNFTAFNFTLSNGTRETFSFNVSILDDSQLEDNETFVIILSAPYSSENVRLADEEIEVAIIDDDVAVLGFLSGEVSGMEGSTLLISVGVSQGFLDISVDGTVQTVAGTAIAGEDYNSTTVPLVFTGQDIFLINLTLIDNVEVDSENETFTVQLVLDDPPPNLQVGLTNITVIILDNGPTTTDGQSSNLVLAGVVSAVAAALVVIILVIAVFLLVLHFQRKKYAKKVSIDANIYDDQSGKDNEYYNMRVRKTLRLNVPKQLIIDSCNLQLDEPVGQGEYGIVYKGKLSKGFTQSFGQVVAVKTLKGFLDKIRVRDLLQECTKMSDFDHPNVLTLTGVCLDGGPAPYIVMPFMFNGSLLSYLKKERDNLVLPPQQELDSETASVSSKLMDMCIQVAKGMEYLASKRVVHRDLAARNCMIDMNFVIKVADFGLSETIDPSKDYFRQDITDGVKLPVKWLAPESLGDGVFSEKSDVWAFGVTCWEVFSGGKMPYSGINPVELPRMLEDGYRMEKPSNSACQDKMYDVVTKCWAGKVEERPTFSDVVTLLSQCLEGLTGYTVLEVNWMKGDSFVKGESQLEENQYLD